MGAHEHRARGPKRLTVALLTVSDTRTPETDTSGRRMRELFEAAGHVVAEQAVVRDEPALVRDYVAKQLGRADIDAVVTSGGTGIAPRDTTYEALAGLMDKRIDGFGELFRMLSFRDIGAAAMLSRATAGVARGRILACLPGSTGAVELALRELLLPELPHMVHLARG
ncbi:MAG TPA: MogA/MoaB family molybdenum cofactor biosynthesis protein [Candidatus Limnocylindria bacterium]|nr:MogA/MoaB family molybdenum cofactor biosynthesis protein [Candidatus Limnocylindria bacterium]